MGDARDIYKLFSVYNTLVISKALLHHILTVHINKIKHKMNNKMMRVF